MIVWTLLPALLAASGAPDDVVHVAARIDASSFEVGSEYAIVLDVRVQSGWSAAASGISNPIVQIKPPASAQLVGKVLTSYRELSRNEFLQAPYERLVSEPRSRIAFKLTGKPGADDVFSISVLAYVSEDPKTNGWLIRRRITLPLQAGAAGVVAAPAPSGWGDNDLLAIGDAAPPFKLPKAGGESVALKDYLGKKNVVVTTYRAHW
ncbi:MAG: hypothetical protein V3T70_03195 [Phycisphaerae bacterium]